MKRSTWLLPAALILAGSQIGHVVAYQARLGTQAQGQAAHGYFPVLMGASTALAGAALVAAVLVMAGARLLGARRRRLAAGPRLPWLELLALVFTLQLATYFAQETLEALISGNQAVPAPELLLWGSLGQLPAAAAVALALSWLSVRFGAALEALQSVTRESCPNLDPVRVSPILAWAYAGEPLRSSAPSVFIKRGPPNTSR